MSSSSSRSHVVHIYRHLLKTSKYLPSKEKRADARLKIREGFKSNLNVEDQTVVQELLSKATSSLGYMKMITPKKFNEGQSGFTKIVFGDATRPTRAVTNWTGSNMDPDSVKRHHASLRRARFKGNADAKGIF
eukprot:gene36096-48584_t